MALGPTYLEDSPAISRPMDTAPASMFKPKPALPAYRDATLLETIAPDLFNRSTMLNLIMKYLYLDRVLDKYGALA